jgi:hypothetical protein
MCFDPKREPKENFTSFEEATQYLEKMTRIFAVRHFSYWSLSLLHGQPDQVTWIATYDPAYMAYYMGHYTPLGDPAFETAEKGGGKAVMIDWSEPSAINETTTAMKQAAARYGIAPRGLSYHFKDGPARNIMFSVNVDCLPEQWVDEKNRIIGGFCGFAYYFHGRVRELVESRQAAA